MELFPQNIQDEMIRMKSDNNWECRTIVKVINRKFNSNIKIESVKKYLSTHFGIDVL